jgi:hypothetical protein
MRRLRLRKRLPRVAKRSPRSSIIGAGSPIGALAGPERRLLPSYNTRHPTCCRYPVEYGAVASLICPRVWKPALDPFEATISKAGPRVGAPQQRGDGKADEGSQHQKRVHVLTLLPIAREEGHFAIGM